MKSVLVLLAIAAVALGGFSWQSRQALRGAEARLTAERAQRERLEQRLRQLEESLQSWPAPASLPPPTPNNSPQLMPPPVRASKEPDAAAAERRFVADILTNPARREAYMAQHRMIARLQYGELIKRLELTPAETDSLLEILAQRQMAMLGRNLGVQTADPATLRRLTEELDNAEASDINALLGADKAARFANYRATLQERSMLTPLVQELDLAGMPLKPSQVDELARILQQENAAMRENAPVSPSALPNPISNAAPVEITADDQRAYAKRMLDWQEELNKRIADRTAQVLSPQQQIRFVAGQQQQIELQRLSMALIEPDAPTD
ncbi:MAG TPA: hypothetical protein P5528_07640 [Steroidobacteraceae bacterium]|nr:hypothetical protein [Steroidobacteraceae bacterium]HRX89303.1 hypothetical protein [Steroidobacteraceae bacterium]